MNSSPCIGVKYRAADRVNIKFRRKHWLDIRLDRLFVCYNGEQSSELRKLLGNKRLKFIPFAKVEFRRVHQPFREEIDLKPQRL